MQCLVDGVSLDLEPGRDLFEVEAFAISQLEHAPRPFRQGSEEHLERLVVLERPVRIGLVGDIPPLGEPEIGWAALEMLADRPVDDLVHDHAVGDRIALAASELAEQALEHILRDVLPCLASHADAASLIDHLLVGGQQRGVVAVLQEQGIFGITGVAHPVA
jgi:hypothetical protein